MAQVKALFYLPLKDLDGRDLAAEIDQVEDELYVRFSGWTCQGYVKGAYEMADGAIIGRVCRQFRHCRRSTCART